MKKIGLIGGIGPESTIEYYRLILKRYQEKLNTTDYPEIMIESINMTGMLNLVFTNQLEKLVDFMVAKIGLLEQTGVDFIAIASNTPHIVFDCIAERVNTPLISIVEETCRVIRDKKIIKVGLLGTKSTMSNGFYQKTAAKYKIQIVTPDAKHQDYIHSKYMSELVFNRIVPETKEQIMKIVRELREKESIEALILGGTELPLILQQSDFTDIKIVDSTLVHVESIVTKMIGK